MPSLFLSLRCLIPSGGGYRDENIVDAAPCRAVGLWPVPQELRGSTGGALPTPVGFPGVLIERLGSLRADASCAPAGDRVVLDRVVHRLETLPLVDLAPHFHLVVDVGKLGEVGIVVPPVFVVQARTGAIVEHLEEGIILFFVRVVVEVVEVTEHQNLIWVGGKSRARFDIVR